MWKTIWRYLKRILIIISLVLVVTIILMLVCQFISGDIKTNVFIVYLIASTILLIWCLTSVTKHRLGFTRTFLTVIFVGIISFVSSIYLDVRSFDDIKDGIQKAVSTKTEDFRNNVDLAISRVELKFINATDSVIDEVKETANELINTNYVYIDGGYLIGADGHTITLKNNPSATNPTWDELKAFLLSDKTDLIEYDFDNFVCADFAEMLHNNAEQQGISAAYVTIQLGPCEYYSTSSGHALNAFETTDKGLVYIDCTGYFTSMNADKIVDVQLGKEYIPRSIFPEPGWSEYWESMGEVEEIEIIQW